MKRVGVLALQGAFAEMMAAFSRAGADTFEIRSAADIELPFDALALPGGESTAQRRLLRATDLFNPLMERIAAGLPVFATCAGLILLAREVEGTDPCFGVLDVTVRRNAYGTQLDSFTTVGPCAGFEDVEMPFIRAPSIVRVGEGVDVLASHDGVPTAVACGHIAAFAFHPEVTSDTRVISSYLSTHVRQMAHGRM